MKKLQSKSSYQKLKEENERLKNDIYTLTVKSDTPEGVSLKMRYQFQSDVDNICFLADFKNEITTTEFEGILNKLHEQQAKINH
jgi:hypothetical protein